MRDVVLGDLRCSVRSDDPDGDNIHRVFIGDCWRREQGFGHYSPNLAKAVDGALRKTFPGLIDEAETIVDTHSSICPASNGQSCYKVVIQLVDGQEISASAGSEGLALFGALWAYYKGAYPQAKTQVLGNLRTQLETVKLS